MIYVIRTTLCGSPHLPEHHPEYQEGLENALNRVAKEGGRILHLLATCQLDGEVLYTIVYEVFQGGRFLNE